jgi:hypothetical protein
MAENASPTTSSRCQRDSNVYPAHKFISEEDKLSMATESLFWSLYFIKYTNPKKGKIS